MEQEAKIAHLPGAWWPNGTDELKMLVENVIRKIAEESGYRSGRASLNMIVPDAEGMGIPLHHGMTKVKTKEMDFELSKALAKNEGFWFYHEVRGFGKCCTTFGWILRPGFGMHLEYVILWREDLKRWKDSTEKAKWTAESKRLAKQFHHRFDSSTLVKLWEDHRGARLAKEIGIV